ncbi:MAG TPA: mercury methylation corrinoid protein HgcA [Negativicutes bacterium]|nr:mercury methylation corrinoid protein HgcA [Negativicutes bacterium]
MAKVPVVGTVLDGTDLKNDRRARLGIGRDDYRVPPGLYAVGKPENTSPVMVTANYKLTFDCLRSELSGINAWIVVIDTKGINVWCAAGKGTFGTNELTGRINALRLRRIVSHNVLMLPQLGAPGVAAHEVFKQCGFRVVYGPLRAEDIKEFLDNGMKATDEMRRIRFGLRERAVLVPIELLHNLKPVLAAYILLLVLNLVFGGHRTFAGAAGTAALNFIPLLSAFVIGCAAVPLLLPWIPFRAFAMKGLLLGLIPGALVLLFPGAFGYSGTGRLVQLSHPS